MSPRANRKLTALCFLALLALAVFGCGAKETAQPTAMKRPAGSKPPVQGKRSSATSPPPQERLDFTGRKDPFRSYVVVTKAALPLPSLSANQLPIQKYEVNQFKVIGIIAGLEENRAMVQDPGGSSYVIKEGSLIGSRNGRVTKILPRYIEVLEQYREENGKIRNRVVKLTLPRKE